MTIDVRQEKCPTKSHLESVSLKDYFERILQEFRGSSDAALRIRSSETDRRLDLLNGEAARLKEMQQTYITRIEYELQHENLRQDYIQRIKELDGDVERILIEVESLKLSRAELNGKASQSALNWAYIVGVAGIVLSVISLVHEFTK